MSVQSTSETLRLVVEDRVATLTFNRPGKLNALSGEMVAATIKALQEIAEADDIGAVVVTGTGRAFCAGGDVSQMEGGAERSFEDQLDRLRRGQELSWLLHSLPKVTIAAVNGFAMGAGLGTALSCDLRFASSSAVFGTAYAKVGFGGDYGTTWQLTRLVGPAKAKELFFLPDDRLDAQQAERLGLVNRVFEPGELLPEVARIATQIGNGPLVSYRYMKENVNLAVDSDFRALLDREALTHVRCGQTEDHLEGVRAFLEKRPPRFRGR